MKLIQPVEAQTIDEITSPTIPFNPPNTISPTPGVTVTTVPTGPSILLQAEKTQLQPGEKVKVQVFIDSNGQEISEFSFQINFNSTMFAITDADPATPNIQIAYVDTFFEPTQNTVTTQTPNSIITLSAATELESATISNRSVAEFELTALASGFSQLEVVRDNSFLLNANSIDVLERTNTIALTVTSENVTPLPTLSPSVIFTPLPSTTPSTGLFDNSSTWPPMLLGAFLVCAGFYLYRIKGKNAKVHR